MIEGLFVCVSLCVCSSIGLEHIGLCVDSSSSWCACASKQYRNSI